MRKTLRRPFVADSNGFTLVEVLISIAIVGIVMGSIYTIFISSNRSYRTQESVADAQQRVRVGIDFIAHDLRLAGLDPVGPATDPVDGSSAGIKLATATNLRLTADIDLNGVIDTPLNQERITYSYNAATRTLGRILYEGTPSESAWQPLIDDVSALTFTYRDSGGNVTATPADIRMVDISMTCQGTGAQGQPINRTLTTRVICRNLYM